jgi:hypothetical protein
MERAAGPSNRWIKRWSSAFLVIAILSGILSAASGTGRVFAEPDPVNFEEGYPKLGTYSSTMAKFTLKLNRAGKVYIYEKPLDFNQIPSDEVKQLAVQKQQVVDVPAGEEKVFILKGLSPETDYDVYFAVEDENEILTVGPAQQIFKTFATPSVTPEEVAAVAGDGQATVTWKPSADVDFSVYMYQGTTAPEDPDDWVDVTGSDGTSQQLVTGLTNGLPYLFAVVSWNLELSINSKSDYVVAGPVTPQVPPVLPAEPASVTVNPGDAQAVVSWAEVAGATHYAIYKYQGTEPPQNPSEWVAVALDAAASPYTLTGLTNGLPYIVAVRSVNADGMSGYQPSGSVTPKSANTGSSSGSSTTPVTSAGEKIKVNVQNGAQTSLITSVEITRLKATDGTYNDTLLMNSSTMSSVLGKAKEAGSTAAVIVLPDGKDEVSKWDLTLKADALSQLRAQGTELVFDAPGVRLSIPASSLDGIAEDIYFRLVPVKNTEPQTVVLDRAKSHPSVADFAGDRAIKPAGRTMSIETNLQSRPVTLVLPLFSNLEVKSPASLRTYIEHSDGSIELAEGTVVSSNGNDGASSGYKIIVNKFSSFTVIQAAEDEAINQLLAHPYVKGYPDGRFGPERLVTRAEVAALLARITGTNLQSPLKSGYNDLAGSHWALPAIAHVTAAGYMKGYKDGSFRPDGAMTRAELSVALQPLLAFRAAAAGPSSEASFSDITSHWAKDAIQSLTAAGIIGGYADGTFRPDKLLTRAELVTLLNRLIGLVSVADVARSWSDVSESHWAFNDIEAATIR